jgi:hypothetical protein
MDLETNASLGPAYENTFTLVNGEVARGVAGYDNILGLPPFFPTRLRLRAFYGFEQDFFQQNLARIVDDASPRSRHRSKYGRPSSRCASPKTADGDLPRTLVNNQRL